MVIRFTRSNFLRLLVISCLFMTSCGNEVPFPRCVSADNFNSSTTIAVSAYYGSSNVDAFKAENGELGDGSVPGSRKQIVRWQDTGLVTDGEEIVVKVEGAWIPWEKNGEKHSPTMAVNAGISRPTDLSDEFYDSVVDVDRICGPYQKYEKQVGGCRMQCHAIPMQDQDGTGQYGRPCWLEKGYGAYLLFKRPNDQDPNATMDLIEFPESPTTHLAYESAHDGGEAIYRSSGRIYDVKCQVVNPERGWKVYVKILDNYYHDNAGGYSLEFTKGVVRGTNTDIFESVRKLVRDELDSAGKKIFQNIAKDKEYRNFVFALITLSIVLTALTYIFGMVRAPLTDLIAKLLKIVLVLLLISPGSWDFFYNHLLRLFLEGVDEIIAVVNEYALGQKVFNKNNPFSFMDIMIRDKIFSTVVWEAKARALITADWSSIFALLIIIIAVLFYVGLCLYGFVIYLTAFVGVTFLISLMPILFVGILFSRFKSLFDGWLTQCISFSMQAILMFTLIAMFGTLIMHYYYRIFGFTACYNEWIHINIPLIINRGYYEWTPGQKYDTITIGKGGTEKRAYPEAGASARYTFTGGGAVIRVPPDYKDEDFRYVDYPFLDPDTKSKTVPGGVVPRDDTAQGRKFQNLAALVNMLVASERGSSIARIVNKIEKELKQLRSSASVTDGHLSKFEDLVSKKRTENPQANWSDPVFKKQLLDILISEIIANNAFAGTPLKELEEQYDYSIIKNIKQGWIVMWSEVFGLILIAFLVWQMRAFVQSIAVALSGGGMMSRTVASMYNEGFARIFSGIPVFGRVIETVDRSIDVARLFARAKIAGIGSAIAEAPEKLIARVPIVGGTIGGMVKGMRHVSGALMSSHTEADLYSMKSISPRFDYARAWLGAHLGYSPLDALQYVGKFSLAKMMGNTSGGLLDNIRQDHAKVMQNLRTLTIGVDKYKPGVYVPKRDEEADKNPFRRPDAAEKRKDEEDRAKLFDDNGNLHIHRGNFWDAVDAMHGLEVMRGQTNDDAARERIQRDIDRIRDEIVRLSRANSSEIPELQDFVMSGGGVDFDRLRDAALKRRNVDERDEISGAEAARQGVVSQAEERSVADLISGTGESEPSAGGSQALTEERIQGGEGTGDRALPEGIEVGGHELADSASALPENQEGGVDSTAEVVSQAEERSVADLISGTGESEPSAGGSQALTEERIQGGEGTGDRALPEGIEVGGHELADSASVSPENQEGGVDSTAEVVSQAEESSVADLISGTGESEPSAGGSQALTEERIQGGEGTGDRALPEGIEVGGHELADSASVSPENQEGGVDSTAEVVSQAEESSVADLMSGASDSSSDVSSDTSSDNGDDVNHALKEESSVTNVGDMEIAEGSGSAFSDPEVRQGGDRSVEVPHAANAAGVRVEDHYHIEDLLSDVGVSDGSLEINFVREESSELGVHEGEGSNYPQKGLSKEKHKGRGTKASSSKRDDKDGAHSGSKTDDDSSGLKASGGSKEGARFRNKSGKAPPSGDRVDSEAISVGEDALEAIASVPEAEALKTVEIPVDKEGDKRDPDEVKAGKKKEEREEIGLIVPNIDQKAELEGDKSEEAPAISGIKQDAVVDSRIIEASRVEGKDYTVEGKPLAEAASADVVTEENVVSAGDEGLDGTLGAEVTAGGDALEATASAPEAEALKTVEIPVDKEGDKRDPDEVKAGKKKEEREEIGLIVPNIDQKAELEGDKSEEAPAISGIKQDAVVDSRIIEASRVEGKDYTVEGKPLAEAASADVVTEENVVSAGDEGLDGTLGAEVTAGGDALEAAASAPEAEALKTVEIPVDKEGDKRDPDEVKAGKKKEEREEIGLIVPNIDQKAELEGDKSEEAPAISGIKQDAVVDSRIIEASRVEGKDYTVEGKPLAEAASADVVTEENVVSAGDEGLDGTLGAEVTAGGDALEAAASAPEAEALKTVEIPVDKEGDKRDSDEVKAGKKKEEREEIGLIVPNIDQKAELEGDKSEEAPAISGIKQDAVVDSRIIEASRVEGKDYTVEGKPLAEAASADVVTEENVVSAGDEGLDGTLGAEVTAGGDALEAAASAPEDAALETLDVPVYQEKDGNTATELPREVVPEATEYGTKPDDQEKDGNTATELPREVVPEATEYGTKPDDQDGDKGDLRPERLDPDIGDGSAIEDEVEVRSSRSSESTDSVPSEVTERDAQRDDQEKDGNTATELPREVVPEATEYGTKPDDQDGDKGDLRPERLDPDIGDGSAIEDEVEVRSSRSSESTDSVPSEVTERDAQRDDQEKDGNTATELPREVVPEATEYGTKPDDQEKDGNTATELPREVVPEATEYGTKPDDQDGDKGDLRPERLDPDIGDGSAIEDEVEVRSSRSSESTDSVPSEVTERDAQRDDQEKDGNTATELPREVVPEATEYGTKPDDQDGDKGDLRPERLDPDIGDGSAIEDEVEVRSSRSSESTDSVPSEVTERDAQRDDQEKDGNTATELPREVVPEATEYGTKPDDQDGDKGDLRPERLDPDIGDGSAIEDEVEVRSSRSSESTDSVPSEVTERDAQRDDQEKDGNTATELPREVVPEATEYGTKPDDQEKDGNTATELPREVVPEATEYGTKPDDQDGDKGDLRPERLDPDIGDGSAIEDEVEVRSSRSSESTDSVPSEVTERDAQRDDQEKDGNTATELPREVVPEATEYGTKPDDQDGDKGDLRPERLDPDIGDGSAIEDEVEVRSSRSSESTDSVPSEVTERDAQRDDQEKDGNTATELPREVVPEATEYGTKPDDQDGDKGDLRPERLDPDIGDGSAIEDEVEVRSSRSSESTDSVPSEVTERDAQRDDQEKDGNTATELPREVVPEATEYGTKPDDQDGDKGDLRPERLDPDIGDGSAIEDEVEVRSSRSSESTDSVPSEVTERDAQRDDQEKDGNTATELPREVVPEATEYGTKPDDQDGDKGDLRPERLDPDIGDGSAIEDEVEVRSSRSSESTDSVPSEVTERDAQRDDQEKDGNTATELPREVVPEATEYGTKPDDQDGDKGDLRPERLDPDIGDGSAIEDEVEVRSSRSSESTDSVPSEVTERDAQRDDQEKDGNTATELPREVVPEATEYGTKPDDQDGDKGDLRPERLDPDIGDGSAIEDEVEVRSSRSSESTDSVPSEVTERDAQRDDQEKDGNTATELPREVVPEATEYGTKPDDQDGDKGDLRPERLDPDIGDGSAIEDEVEVRSSRSSESTDSVPSEVTERDAQRDDQEKDGNTATELPREVVPEATEYGTKPDDQDGDKGDLRPERLDPDIGDGSAIEDEVEVRSSRSSESTDSVPSEVTERDAQRDDQEKDGNTATELPREVVPEATEYGTKPDDQDGDKGDLRPERLDPDIGDGSAIEDEVEVRSSRSSESTDSVPSEVTERDAQRDDQEKDGNTATELPREVVPEATEYGTKPDDQEKDGNTATELPREVVPEATEYGTKPDDQDGDKGDLRPERLDPDIGDGSAIEDEVEVRSSRSSESTDSVPSEVTERDAQRDDQEKDGNTATELPREVVPEATEYGTKPDDQDGDKGDLRPERLDPDIGDGSAIEDEVEVRSSRSSESTDSVPSEVTERDAQRDDQEKDGNTATELPREVVPEATEYGTKPDDQDGDKGDLRPERLDPDIGDGSAIEDEVEVRSSRSSESTDSVPSEVTERDAQRDDQEKDGNTATELPREVVPEATEYGTKPDDQEKDGNTATELPREVVPEATEYGTKPDDQDGDKGDLRPERLDPDIGDGSAIEDEVEVRSSRSSESTDSVPSEVTERDAQRDDQEKDGNTATELPREVVPEATEYGTKPDDQDGDKGDLRPERLDPDIGDGSAIEDEVEVRSSRSSESTDSVPSEVTERDAQRDDQEKDGNTATELPREVVPEATEYGTKPDDQDGDKGDLRPERLDPDIGDGSAIEDEVEVRSSRSSESTDSVPSEVTERDAQRDDQEKDGNTATELPREVVPEATEYGTKPDDQDGDKGDLRPERLDPDIGDGSAIEDEVEVRSSRSSESTDSVPSEVTERDAQRDDQEKDGNTATELPREVVPEATEYGTKPDDQDGDKGDLRPERLDPDIGDGSAIEDEVEVRSSRSSESTDSVPSEVTERDAQRDDQEKDGNTATELPREVVPEATEYGTKPDDQDGDKGDLRPERLDPDIGDGSAIEDEVEVRSSRSSESTDSVPSEVTERDAQRDDQEKDGNTATELPREVVPEATEYGTKPDDQDGDKGDLRPERLDPDIGDGSAIEDEVEVRSSRSSESTDSVPSEVTERDAQRDDQEKDGNTATELPREVVPEATEYGTKPDDQDGDKGDLRPERLDPDIGDGSAIEDEVEVRSSRSSESTDSVPSEVTERDAQRDDQEKDGNTATELPREVVPEATEYGTKPDDQDGDKGDLRPERLDPDIGDGSAIEDEVEVRSSRSSESTDSVPSEVTERDAQRDDQEKDGNTATELPREVVPEATEYGTKPDDQEKDGNTATELPREVVPEATEYGTKPDDQDGDKGDLRPERLDPDIGDGSAIEDEVEVRSSRSSESTDSVPSEVTERDAQRDDQEKDGNTATELPREVVPEATEYGTKPDDQEKDGNTATELPREVVPEATEYGTKPDDQEKDGNTATELPREVVPEATEYGTKPDDQDGDKGDLRPERLDPDIGDGSAIEDEVEVRSSRSSESTDSVPSEVTERDAQRDDQEKDGNTATELPREVVPEATEYGTKPDDQDGDKGDLRPERLDPDIGDGSAIEDEVEVRSSRSSESTDSVPSEVTERDAQRDDQEKDGNTATELPREVVPEATEYGTKPDDQDGDKGDLRPERLDPDIGDGSAIEDEVEVRSSRSSESTDSVPSEVTERDAQRDDQDGDKGDLRPERLDPDIGDGSAIEDEVEVRSSRSSESTDSVPSEVTERDAQRDDQEKDGNTATELPREVVPEATEYGTKPDDQDGDKGDLRPERLDPDIGDGSAIEDEVEVRSSRSSESTDSVPSEVTERDDQEKDGNTATELPREVVPEATEYGTKPDDQDGDKGDLRPERLDPDIGDGSAIEDEVEVRSSRSSESTDSVPSEVTERDAQRDDQEKDGNTATELPREVVPEATEYGTKPDDQDGDKGDLRPERLDPDIGDGSAIEDEVEVRSSRSSESTDSVPSEVTERDAQRDDQDGDKGDLRPERLDPDIGDGSAIEDEVEVRSSRSSESTDSVPSEVTERDAQRDDQEKDGNTATELPREVVPEATEYGTKPDDQDGDKGDLRPERLDPDIGDGSAIEDEVEVRSSRSSESTDSVPSEVTERDDQEKDGNTATELPREVVPEATEYGTKPDDQDGDKGDLRPERLDPDIGDGSAIEDEVEVRSSKKTLLMRRGQIDVSVVSTATKDIASEALKSGKEEDVVRDTSSKVAAPIEDRGLLKTESDVTTAAQKQSDTDTLELFSGTSSDKKKAKKGDAGKSKKRKPKRKEGQPSGVSTHEILKGLLSTMTSENISHQDKSLPEKDQEQDASKETHQDEKKKSQEKEREEKAQKQKSSISKMQRKISKLKSRIAQGNLTEDEIQVLKNKIAEIEADINGLDS
ncbi:type IV secretion system protein [Anaplasma phagocytophilum]|uniref:type IV secretion system protein n=1 Tax=Anaplasma phagocytophilum TaxID=948 RepID=UPI001E574090|nr:type IV secretion system protein [Anaplasma phagocytophilum]